MRLFDEGKIEVGFKERDLLPERPRSDELAEKMGRGFRDETRFVEPGRQDVASPAAADEDLAPAVAGALEEERLDTRRGGEDRRHRPGRARADHDDASFAQGCVGHNGQVNEQEIKRSGDNSER